MMKVIKKLFCVLGRKVENVTAEKKDFQKVFLFGSEGVEDDGGKRDDAVEEHKEQPVKARNGK